MKFSAKEDIDAPLHNVFAMITDFEAFQRIAMRRGADVTRVDTLPEPGVGMEWKVVFDFRGRQRKLNLKLSEYDSATGVALVIDSPSISGSFRTDLLALSRTRTRMSVELDVQPMNLSARLLIQSLRLAKANLNKRFKLRVAEYAKDMEDRFNRMV